MAKDTDITAELGTGDYRQLLIAFNRVLQSNSKLKTQLTEHQFRLVDVSAYTFFFTSGAIVDCVVGARKRKGKTLLSE